MNRPGASGPSIWSARTFAPTVRRPCLRSNTAVSASRFRWPFRRILIGRDASGFHKSPNKDDEDDFSELETVDATDAEEGDEATNGDDQPSASQTFHQVSREVLIAPVTAIYGTSQCVDARSGEILDAPKPGTSQFCLHTPLFCPHCNATFSSRAVRLFSIRLGGPFLLGSIVPELLDDALEAPVPITDGDGQQAASSRRSPAIDVHRQPPGHSEISC